MVKYLPYLLALALGAILAWAIIPKAPGENKELKKEKKEFLDSAKIEQRIQVELAKRDSEWTRIHSQRKDSLDQAHKETIYWRTKYEKVKLSPVTKYTVHGLDSAVDALIASRQH